ncbi:MAG: 16S rRNA (adenine(1518)-N(6)/adenine(1519)-N(6))-dimethyltransferase RsmA [Myxococcota bacterium]|nr:16S rRNA (adenine(1518)-N(6)/adenine(1519)-N(6))-dimethyltransferase RsmA [Myxococcota bacterium]
MSTPPWFEHPAAQLKSLEQRARKRFGQNFLVDPTAVRRIAQLGGVTEGTRVLEIGPGLGALTRALRAAGGDVHAIELDRDLADYIETTLPTVKLTRGDAMKVDLEEAAPGSGWVCCANLPYNVGTRILLRLLPRKDKFDRLVLMFQREVATRLVAQPRTKSYGSLTVMARAYARIRHGFALPPGAFHPAPKVHSAVVVFDLRDEPELGGATPEGFEKAVRAGFSQRRKTLANAMGSVYGKEPIRELLTELGMERRRAEELTLAEWGVVAKAVERLEPPA